MKKLILTTVVFCIAGLFLYIAVAQAAVQPQNQEKISLTGVRADTPIARIINWDLPAGVYPQVNVTDGWQEQALRNNDVICNPAIDDGDPTTSYYVLIALDRPAYNTVYLAEGSCLTIDTVQQGEIEGVLLGQGEALFDIGSLLGGSPFKVTTPNGIIGVSGTLFNVKYDPVALTTAVYLLESAVSSIEVKDKTDDQGEKNKTTVLYVGSKYTIIENETNLLEALTTEEISELETRKNKIISEVKKAKKKLRKDVWSPERQD